MSQMALEVFASLAIPAFSIALTWAFGGKIVNSFLEMAFRGRFKI